jgi:hypothetical protein
MATSESEFLIQTRAKALKAVNKKDIPKKYAISSDHFLGLGPKTHHYAIQVLDELRSGHGENLPFLFGIALRELSLHWAMDFIEATGDAMVCGPDEKYQCGGMEVNEYLEKMAKPDAYEDGGGFSQMMSESLFEESLEQATFREGTPYKERPYIPDLFTAMAVHFFAVAAEAMRSGDAISGSDWIHDAYDFLKTAHGNVIADLGQDYALHDASEGRGETGRLARSALAKAAAQAKHTGNRADKAKVFVWCDQNMNRFSSMDDAASDIAETFMPQKFRAVRDWMTEWRKLRSTGTP